MNAFNRAERIVKGNLRSIVKMVGWEKLEEGWVKLNIDGSVRLQNNLTGCGGVIRGKDGEWKSGFCYRLGCTNTSLVELWAVFHGLRLTWSLGFKKVFVEIDSDQVVHWLTAESPEVCQSGVLMECKRFFKVQWEVKIEYVYREANQVANVLAAKACHLDRGILQLRDPLAELYGMLLKDVSGIKWSRKVRY